MPPQDTPQPPTPLKPQVHNPLAVMQPGEQTLFELKRHPIGILLIYAMTAFVLGVLGVIALVVAPGMSPGSSSIAVSGFVLFMMLAVIFNLVATIVYWGNRWILTDDSITQIAQTSLFHKETSSLGLESLEDVTAEKNGILTHIFNYGTLKAETAGHRSKFVFPYAPDPTSYAQQILEARERENMEKTQQPSYPYPPQNPGPPAQQPPMPPPARPPYS